MQEQYYAIKVNSTNGIAHRKDTGTELALLKRIAEVNPKHLGWRYVRKLVDDFSEPGPQGDHVCLVFEPLREPLWLFCRRFVDGVIPSGVLKPMLCMVLEGLDCLHSECHIIHTGHHFQLPSPNTRD